MKHTETFDQFVSSEELTAALTEVLHAAKTDGKRLQIEVRLKPIDEASRQEHLWVVDPKDINGDKLRAALEGKLMQSPGPGYIGTIRLNFRPPGDSANPWTSYSRTIAENDSPAGGTEQETINRQMGWQFRYMSLSAERDRASADLVKSASKAIDALTKDRFEFGWKEVVGVLATAGTRIFASSQRSATSVTYAAQTGPQTVDGQPDVPRAQPIETQPAPSREPTDRPVPPSRQLSRQEVKDWAKSNQTEAYALVMELAGEMEPPP